MVWCSAFRVPSYPEDDGVSVFPENVGGVGGDSNKYAEVFAGNSMMIMIEISFSLVFHLGLLLYFEMFWGVCLLGCGVCLFVFVWSVFKFCFRFIWFVWFCNVDFCCVVLFVFCLVLFFLMATCCSLRGSHLEPESSRGTSPASVLHQSCCLSLTDSLPQPVWCHIEDHKKSWKRRAHRQCSSWHLSYQAEPSCGHSKPGWALRPCSANRAAKGMQVFTSHGKNHIYWVTNVWCLLRAETVSSAFRLCLNHF